MQNRNEIKFLIIDYDGCAHSNYDVKRSDWLSPQLVGHAQSSGYSGFYGCTHRSFFGQSWYLYFQDCLSINTEFTQNDLTYKITENFKVATELNCIAVSMQDDILYSDYGCGYAYENIIKPFEEKRQLPSSEMKYNSMWQIWSNHNSKNPQLVQIAQHATKNTDLETLVTLDYIDDREALCEEAIRVVSNENWPKNVSLNVYHHCANSNIVFFGRSGKQEEIIKIGVQQRSPENALNSFSLNF